MQLRRYLKQRKKGNRIFPHKRMNSEKTERIRKIGDVVAYTKDNTV